MTLTNLVSSFVEYIKQTWENSPSTASPLSADRLNFMETGIQNNSDAITAIANAVTDDTSNSSSDKIASQAAVNSIAEKMLTTYMHRNIFRGKNLGTSLTSAQVAAIQAGTFDDLYVGDYWVINSVTWRIADFDYWYKTGDTSCTSHHVVIMPDTCLYDAQMNSTNTTSGGYVGSEMYTTNLADAKTTINSAFGSSHVLSHREYLTNAITSGYPSAGAWYDSTVELPNEIMIYGSHIFKPLNSLGATIPNSYTVCKTQLALAAFSPQYINIRHTYWLRDVVSAAAFAYVSAPGYARYDDASYSYGVRPAFGIC